MAKIGVAIIGASIRSTVLFEYLKDKPDIASITGIYDVISERGRYLLDEYSHRDAKIYDSLEQAVNDDNAQAIFIGTPDFAHVEPAVAALRAGKHVYCEKPMAITLQDCDTIIDAAKKSNAIFYLGMNLRHSPVHEAMHEIITGGELGKLLTIEANEYYYGGRTYFRRWNRLRKFGGGLWITKACHDFDILNWFAGSQPINVFATCNLSYYKSDPQKGIICRSCRIKDTCPDYYDVNAPAVGSATETAVFRRISNKLSKITEDTTGQMRDICLYNSDKDTFDNGIVVVEYGSDIRATYTLNVVSSRDTRQLRLMGTDGAAEGDTSMGKIRVWKRHSGNVREIDVTDQMKSSHGGADFKILNDFFECCKTGKKPRSSWADGKLGIKVALAATESSDTKKMVELT